MRELCDRVAEEVGKVVVGRREPLEIVMAALALGGHVLLEGVPGVAKTLLADATARALGVEFRRLPDGAVQEGVVVHRVRLVEAGQVAGEHIDGLGIVAPHQVLVYRLQSELAGSAAR